MPMKVDTRDAGSIPGSGGSSRGGHSSPLQYSCLENPMDREAWHAIVHRATHSQTGLKQHSTHVHMHLLFIFISCWCHIACWISVPDQGLNVGHGTESPESQPLGHQGTPPHTDLYAQESYCFLAYNIYFHGDAYTESLLFLCREYAADFMQTWYYFFKEFCFLEWPTMWNLHCIQPHVNNDDKQALAPVSGAELTAQLSWWGGALLCFSYSPHSLPYGKWKQNRHSNTAWMLTNTSSFTCIAVLWNRSRIPFCKIRTDMEEAVCYRT